MRAQDQAKTAAAVAKTPVAAKGSAGAKTLSTKAPPGAVAAAVKRYEPEGRPSEERERLILEHLPQVRLIARRIHERLPESVNLDDLIPTRTIGLIAAIDRFDPVETKADPSD